MFQTFFHKKETPTRTMATAKCKNDRYSPSSWTFLWLLPLFLLPFWFTPSLSVLASVNTVRGADESRGEPDLGKQAPGKEYTHSDFPLCQTVSGYLAPFPQTPHRYRTTFTYPLPGSSSDILFTLNVRGKSNIIASQMGNLKMNMTLHAIHGNLSGENTTLEIPPTSDYILLTKKDLDRVARSVSDRTVIFMSEIEITALSPEKFLDQTYALSSYVTNSRVCTPLLELETSQRFYLVPTLPADQRKARSEKVENSYQVFQLAKRNVTGALLAKAYSPSLPLSQVTAPNSTGLRLCLAHSVHVHPEASGGNRSKTLCSSTLRNPVALLAPPSACPMAHQAPSQPFYLFLTAQKGPKGADESKILSVDITIEEVVMPPQVRPSTAQSKIRTSLSLTSVFLLLLLAFLWIYLVGGCFLRFCKGYRSYPEILPHHTFWCNTLPSLCRQELEKHRRGSPWGRQPTSAEPEGPPKSPLGNVAIPMH